MCNRLLAAFLVLMMLLSSFALAEGEFPARNEDGFLDEGEFVYEDPDAGVWRYVSPTLKIEIIKYTQKSPKRVWFEAEVWTRGDEVFRMIPDDPDDPLGGDDWPYRIARENKVVLAVNSDYAQNRVFNKQRVGIVIRNGEILYDTTKKANAKGFPTLDTLALLPGGDMKVFLSDELKAEDYIAMGAYDVLAFGPVLIRDGELNEYALKKYGTSHAQRTAIGMVEPGHYFVMMLEGRHSKSTGDGISFLAEKLYDRGCTLGFNLDGGATSCIVFMGKQLNISNGDYPKASARATADILGIGTSELVPEPAKK